MGLLMGGISPMVDGLWMALRVMSLLDWSFLGVSWFQWCYGHDLRFTGLEWHG